MSVEMPYVLDSEFARIKVDIDGSGRGPRLHLTDLRTGFERWFDPLEVETLMWLPDEHLKVLLDPSSDRWREDI